MPANMTSVLCLTSLLLFASTTTDAQTMPKIAVFAGPQATILNSVPLVTSNKAREKYGLEPLRNPNGSEPRFDHLAPQRLAAPVEVLIEMYSAHPLEQDAAELYGPPDGYVDRDGNFHKERQDAADKPVYKVTLTPDDGLYLLPYMSRQADGKAWDDDCAHRGAPSRQCRQPFFPVGARIFEEIDRGLWGLDSSGLANALASKANFDFFRAVPSAGYRKGLPASLRTDTGDGDIPPEVMGEDFFTYRPFHLRNSTRFHDLAVVSNTVKKALDSGQYGGAIWFEASPYAEETIYWLNLIIDTPIPIVGTVAQRNQRGLSADGPLNIVDAVNYILSRQWAGADGRDELGAVFVEAEKIIASRQVQKSDARPGGYIATGDHGGVLGTIGNPGPITIYFKPLTKHTWNSSVNLSRLPDTVQGVTVNRGALQSVIVTVKDQDGFLIGRSVPRVSIVKHVRYHQSATEALPSDEADIIARIDANLESSPLSGFVAEGASPYGNMTVAQMSALEIAVYSGMPTVLVGRGNAGGLTAVRPYDVFVEGNNLTASKARMLLIASMMKIGSMPIAKDPAHPTADETVAVKKVVADYQKIFNTH